MTNNGSAAAADGARRHTAFRIDRAEIRREDYSLSNQQREIRKTFARLFSRQCPAKRVREAEPLGFDSELWQRVARLEAVPPRAARDGGEFTSLVDLTLIAEEVGRAAAPVPYSEAVAASGALGASAARGARELARQVRDGSEVVSLALEPVSARRPAQLVPAGAIATQVLALDGDELVLLARDSPPVQARNLGAAPLAWWDVRDHTRRTVIEAGPNAHTIFVHARREWRLLTAAALTGAGKAALTLAVEFANTRLTSGVPIGALQGISHPLARADALLAGARHLTWKAAWFHDNEPKLRAELAPMAFVQADNAATYATATALHAHGGFGFTLASDVSIYFGRAKAWSVPGDPRAALREVAEAITPPDTDQQAER